MGLCILNWVLVLICTLFIFVEVNSFPLDPEVQENVAINEQSSHRSRRDICPPGQVTVGGLCMDASRSRRQRDFEIHDYLRLGSRRQTNPKNVGTDDVVDIIKPNLRQSLAPFPWESDSHDETGFLESKRRQSDSDDNTSSDSDDNPDYLGPKRRQLWAPLFPWQSDSDDNPDYLVAKKRQQWKPYRLIRQSDSDDNPDYLGRRQYVSEEFNSPQAFRQVLPQTLPGVTPALREFVPLDLPYVPLGTYQQYNIENPYRRQDIPTKIDVRPFIRRQYIDDEFNRPIWRQDIPTKIDVRPFIRRQYVDDEFTRAIRRQVRPLQRDDRFKDRENLSKSLIGK